jgi:hypothetical protein
VYRVREYLTELYFANNLDFDTFLAILRRVRAGGEEADFASAGEDPMRRSEAFIFEMLEPIEAIPRAARTSDQQAALDDGIVELISRIISGHQGFVAVARHWLTVKELRYIAERKIGYGTVGGKAAGMLLARAILRHAASPEVNAHLTTPESWFLGTNLMYDFMSRNGLMGWNRQKYKTPEKIEEQYPRILQDYLQGEFPADLLGGLREMLRQLHGKPLIVRSSSLLEDNFQTSFAGKYDSFFCPNQGSEEENLEDLKEAIIRVYASTLRLEPLLYRRSKDLVFFDEQMGILIQVVAGKPFGRYFFPDAAGVGFSRNLYRWSPRIKRDDGFLRLVWGLGTRAVDNTSDYPRLVSLSTPTLRPEASTKSVQRYSQQFIDLIDLQANALVTQPVRAVLTPRYPALRYIAQLNKDGFLSPIRANLTADQIDHLVITCDELLRRTDFPAHMKEMLQVLERAYGFPIDLEFAIDITNANPAALDYRISLLQCRPQSHLADVEVRLPERLDPASILFATPRMVPRGQVCGISHLIYVPPEQYFALPTENARILIGRGISAINQAFKNAGITYIALAPGRWGTSNSDLGVRVGYTDIFHARALVELTGFGAGPALEPSFGTHFFQDLMESNTYPLHINAEEPDTAFDRAFLNNAPNCLDEFITADQLQRAPYLRQALRVIRIADTRPGWHLDLIMDDEKQKAVCFFAPDTPAP